MSDTLSPRALALALAPLAALVPLETLSAAGAALALVTLCARLAGRVTK